MFERALNRLHGYERLRNRGDQFFLSGDFARALAFYRRARSLLRDDDHRVLTVDALMRDAESQLGAARATARTAPALAEPSEPAEPAEPAEDDTGALLTGHPGLDDLFELAIAEKLPERRETYRALGDAFKAGYVALLQGNAERAVRFLRRAASELGSSFVAHMELGRAYSLLGDMVSAREALEVVRRLAPDDVEGVVLLAAVDIELGGFDRARQSMEALVHRGSDDPEITFLLGRALFGLKRYDAALARFRETVRAEPHFHEAFFEGARVLRQMGDSEGAFELMNRAAKLAPDEIRYNRELVKLVLEEGHDPHAGLAACDRLMVTDEESAWQYLAWIAELYLRKGWQREALDPLQKALHLVPPDRRAERVALERRLAELSAGSG